MKRKIIFAFMLTLIIPVVNVSAQMRVHLINVGQGCATLIEFPCAAILVDAGGETNTLFNSSDSLKKYLDDFFAGRPDLHHTLQCVYLTHPHKDHTNGISVILQPPYVIRNAVTDGLGLMADSANNWQVRLHMAVQDAEDTPDPADDIGFQPVTTNLIGSSGFTNPVIDPVDCPGTNPVIKILWGASPTPPPGWGEEFKNPNNHSLVVRIEYGTSSLLITGDLEVTAMRNLLAKYNGTNLLDVDVYVVGHHGSKNGTTKDFLNKMTPQIALIGVGDPARETIRTAWDYGHPNIKVLDSLKSKLTGTRTSIDVLAGTGKKAFVDYTVTKAIYATGWDGNVVLEADATGHWRKVETILVPALLNINTATLSELQTLPGIGATKAQAIIDFRTSHGNFTSIDNLDNVPGIGPATIKLVRPYVRI